MFLSVVMYHYVRDLPRTPWPRIKGVLLDDFRRQLASYRDRFEMATLESALAFLSGTYNPPRPMCLLTFDDGLKEHYADVTPLLARAGVHGVFFLQTSAPLGRVAAVHKQHFLLAALGFESYRSRFIARLTCATLNPSLDVDDEQVRRVYRWDPIDVARFKYLVNFVIADDIRLPILDELFSEVLGGEQEFARRLYIDWAEAREMQAAGMVLGGHSHAHEVLSKMTRPALRHDLVQCGTLLGTHLRPQPLWPFSYPYGHADATSANEVRQIGFSCAFTTQVGPNDPGGDVFRIRRFDPKDAAEVTVQLCTS